MYQLINIYTTQSNNVAGTHTVSAKRKDERDMARTRSTRNIHELKMNCEIAKQTDNIKLVSRGEKQKNERRAKR